MADLLLETMTVKRLREIINLAEEEIGRRDQKQQYMDFCAQQRSQSYTERLRLFDEMSIQLGSYGLRIIEGERIDPSDEMWDLMGKALGPDASAIIVAHWHQNRREASR